QQAERGGRALDLEFETRNLADREAALAALEDGDVEAVVGTGGLLVTDDAPDEALAVLAEASSQVRLLEQLEADGIRPERAAAIVDSSNPQIETVGTEDSDSGQGIAAITTLLLYLALVFCGYAVTG